VLDLPGLPEQALPPEVALSGVGLDALLDVADVDVLALPVLPAPRTPARPPDAADEGAEDGDGADGDGDGDGDGGILLGPGAAAVFEALGIDPFALRPVARASGRTGEVVSVPLAREGGPSEVLLVGVGAATGRDLRRAGAALARRCRDRGTVLTTLAAVASDDTPDAEPLASLGDLVAGLVLGSFGVHVRSAGPASRPVERVLLAGLPDDGDGRDALGRALTRAGAAWSARALATVPSNVKDPAWMVERARAAAEAGDLDVRVWDESQLLAEGFGGIAAVGRASATPPRLVQLDYAPRRAGRRTPRVVLVGKGITFDSGGLSIKPAEGMVTMKRDMTGGAVVIAVLGALRALGCPVRVTGLVPLAENAVSGDALRPGDVIRHWGGRTTEVTNTDAEGRLVLADGLAYGVAELEPTAILDVATLTGAMKVALGQRTGGLFADDDALADHLLDAGRDAGEPLWRMPLTEDYTAKLASPVADADNAPGGPGATTAALFLRPFTGDVPWAHLDIASVGDSPSDWHEWSAGPTGFGVRLLLDWLCSADPLLGVGSTGPAAG